MINSEKSKKRFYLDKVLILLAIICVAFATLIIGLYLDNAEISIFANSANKMKANFASTESNTWDVSENGDGSVIATLDENSVLTISGTGNMKSCSAGQYDWDFAKVNIKSVIIEEGVTKIGTYAFYNYPNLTKIEIADSVIRIETGVLTGCINLTSIKIPANVSTIGHYPFENCKSLKQIEVDENNVNYYDDEGVLYIKDSDILIRYPEGKEEIEYTILDGTNEIEWKAFGNCISLKTINIPNTVTRFGYGAFEGCTNLTNIIIPRSVTKIGGMAFYGCYNVTILCHSNSYAETYAQENKIPYQTIYLSSTEQEIDEINLTIRNLQPKTTVQGLKNSLQSDISYEILSPEGNVIQDVSNIVKTGYKIKLEDDKTYTLIITGDSTGDGQADLKDILAINKHRLNKADLTAEYLQAGDVNEDGTVDIKDILQINKFRLGKTENL